MAEEEINSRLHVGCEVGVFQVPATLTLSDVVSERDAEMESPIRTSPRWSLSRARGGGSADCQPAGPSSQEGGVREFVLRRPALAITLRRGGCPLMELRASPDEVSRDGTSGQWNRPRNAGSLNAYAHGLGDVRELRLEDASIDFVIEGAGMVVEARRVDMRFDRIEVDPSALEDQHGEGRD